MFALAPLDRRAPLWTQMLGGTPLSAEGQAGPYSGDKGISDGVITKLFPFTSKIVSDMTKHRHTSFLQTRTDLC